MRIVASVGSTNAELKRLARDGAAHGTALFARRQTDGRGRLGRAWAGGEGNVHLSVLVRPRGWPIARAPLACLAAAVATCEAVGRGCVIKWPNDVLAPDGRKVAGVLAEVEGDGGVVSALIIGVGVNVVTAPPLPSAACLAELGEPPDAVALAEAIAAGTLRWCASLDCAPVGVLGRWRELSGTLGRRVRIGGIEGIADDIDADGALIVRTDDGARRRIVAGDVEMVAGMGGTAR